MKPCEFCQEFSQQKSSPSQESMLPFFSYKDRVISSDGVWNLIPTLGSFIEGYTLLVARAHRPSLYHCTLKEKEMYLAFLHRLEHVYKIAYGSNVIMFEHGVVDEAIDAPNSVSHVHLHFLPCRENYSSLDEIFFKKNHFKKYATSNILQLNEIIDKQKIKAYLLYYFSNHYYIVDITTEKLPSQILRKVFYQLEYSADDDGWNWRTHPFVENMHRTYRTLKPIFEDLITFEFSERVESYEKEAAWINDAQFIQPLTPPPFGKKKFLDVACGTGIISEYAKKTGWSVTAVDTCREMLNKVEDAIYKVHASAENLPFPQDSFDLVVCRQGIQYMNMRKALQEMIRVSSKQILLLHATVDSSEVLFWQTVFHALGYIGKRIIASCEIQDTIKKNFNCVQIQYDKTFFTRETIRIPDPQLSKLEELIQATPLLPAKSNISFVKQSKCLHYTLEWHLISIKKMH